LLQGYFGSEVSDQVISKTGRIILEWFLDELKTMPRYGSLEMLSWFGMFSMRFTLETMELLMPVFTQSNLGNTYPLPYGPGPIFRNYFEFYQEECFRVGQITATSQFFKP
jgi:hypothetical protein